MKIFFAIEYSKCQILMLSGRHVGSTRGLAFNLYLQFECFDGLVGEL